MEAEEDEIIKSNLNTLWYSFSVIILIILVVLIIIFTVNDKSDIITSDKFKITLEGNSLKYVRVLKKAFETVDDIIKPDAYFAEEKIPVTITTISSFSSPDTLATGRMNDRINKYKGGKITLLDGLEDKTNLPVSDIIIHEILHVIGIGSSEKWNDCVGGNFLKNTSYCFPKTFEKYETYTHATPPIEGDGVPLTSGSHWNEEVFGKEIMTPVVNAENRLLISKVTVSALEDLGFKVNMDSKYISQVTSLPF